MKWRAGFLVSDGFQVLFNDMPQRGAVRVCLKISGRQPLVSSQVPVKLSRHSPRR
jgi:hypothetical protein